MKKIIFSLLDSAYEIWSEKPVPSSKMLPEWYKKTTSFKNNKIIISSRGANRTVKKCVPFFDAISSGYLITLNADVFVDNTGSSEGIINWTTSLPIVGGHGSEQLENFSIPKEYYDIPFKWMNSYHIDSPKGYSCFFHHPLNRIDLPFYTLSGVVDTDKYSSSVNFPFLLKKDFYGIIKRGTPIAQVIPFKREDWKMNIGKTKNDLGQNSNKYVSYIQNAYKKMDWSRKKYL